MSKILAIDDDPVLLDMLQEYLEAHGHLVLKATKPQEAHRLFQDTKPDLVILDVIMPRTDGFKLLKQFKESSHPFKSIVLSGLADETCRQQAEALAADRYLVKPVDLEKFKMIIESLLR